MEKKKVGAPSIQDESKKKKSMTCSITPETNNKAEKHFGNRGTAIELAVKYHKVILQKERELKKQNAL